MMSSQFREVPRVGDKFVVVKNMPKGWEQGAEKDDILTVKLWGGFPCLVDKHGLPVCDYNSPLHRDYCKAL
jgi:hypothetical protein